MSESVRQNNLFAAEDWKVVYNAFRNVSLQAYDYESIYTALIDYLRINNPDEFNDYVQHSEMMAHVNMLAYLGQSLAFRIDLNARENFFDTAGRRESVLKLARSLSYKPKRNRAASGIAKLVSVQTTEPLIDSNGVPISNTEITWEQINNPSWYDNFVRVLNRAFISTNLFGEPVKRDTRDGIDTHIYAIDNISISDEDMVFPFTSAINGDTMNFEVVSADLDDGFLSEYPPISENRFNIIYRNDQLGSSSPNNGFFVHFKQGRIETRTFDFESPVPDREVIIDVDNINETDVWLHEVSPDGKLKNSWIPVDSLVGQNIVYNDIYLNQRKIYSVETVGENQIRIRFSDGNFGDVPVGTFRVKYRVSKNESYIIRPNDIRRKAISIKYKGKDNQEYYLTLKFSLQYNVDNADAEESTDEIKRNAPASIYTQDRMINGEDYNVFPLTQTNLVRKIKSVNRTHAGHSRYIDITDPTGSHSNVSVIGDDAYLYKDYGLTSNTVRIQNNTNFSAIVRAQVEPLLGSYGLDNFFYHDVRRVALSEALDNLGGFGSDFFTIEARRYIWKSLPTNRYSTNGYIFDKITNQTIALGANSSNTKFKMIRQNTKVLFRNDFGAKKWVTIKEISNGGLLTNSLNQVGPVAITSSVEDGWYVSEIVPGLRKVLSATERGQIQSNIENNYSFGMRYDFINDEWVIIPQDNIVNTDNVTFDLNSPAHPNAPDNRWLVKADFINDQGSKRYVFISRQLRYVFGSDKQVRFFFKNTSKVIDYETGRIVQDYINILDSNSDKRNINEQTASARVIVGHFYTSSDHDNNKEYDITAVVPYNSNIGNIRLYTSDKRPINNWNISFSNDKTLLKISDSVLPVGQVTPFKVSDVVEVYDISGAESTLSQSYKFSIVSEFIRSNGVVDYSKVLVTPEDSDDDGEQDFPLAFEDIVNLNEYIFFRTYMDIDSATYTRVDNSVLDLNDNTTRLLPGIVYHCSSTITINDNFGDSVTYIEGNFYKGDSEVGGIVPNRASLLVNATDNDGVTYSAYIGRSFSSVDPFLFQWKHYAGGRERIDPSISNVIDTYVLTRSYDNAIRRWLNNRESIQMIPTLPTSNEIKNNLQFIERKKSTSDQIIYIPARYKMLFGESALPEYRAKFKVVKAVGAYLSDNAIKSQIVQAINEFFDIDNWDFGAGFYFTELSTYIHTKLLGSIASIVIVPEDENSRFGELFEIRAEPNELFLSTATVENIEIVRTYTDANLRK